MTKAIDLSIGVKNHISFTSNVVSALSSFFQSQWLYANGYEDIVCKLAGETLGKDDYQPGSVLSTIVTGIPAFAVFHPIITARLASEGERVFYSHYPELCLSWIDSLSGKDEYVAPRSRRLTIACPVDVNVYDSEGTLVAQIVDDSAVEISDSMIEYYVNEEGEKVVVLPYDAEYSVEITATNNGTMTYRVEDTDLSNDYSHTVEYTEIEIEKDAVYSASVEMVDAEAVENIDYPLTKDDGRDYVPDVDTIEVGSPAIVFEDVDPNEYYVPAVSWAVAKGVTAGTSATTFSPDEGCTRGQVVTFLWRAAGQPEPSGTKNPFKDVKSGEYYYNAVLWAVENGITSGTSATTFSPEDVCTRGQIVTFLWRANGKPTPSKTSNPSKDVKSGDYFYDAVLWAVEKGITLGTDATHFSPSDTCTRGQVVTFLYRAVKE